MAEKTSTSAKILYRPVGLASSVVGGLVAGEVFKQVWRRAAPVKNLIPQQRWRPAIRSGRSCLPPPSKGRSSRS